MAALKTYLQDHDLSQADFARLLGVAAALVSQWLSGARRPGLANALAIERATAGAVPAEAWVEE